MDKHYGFSVLADPICDDFWFQHYFLFKDQFSHGRRKNSRFIMSAPPVTVIVHVYDEFSYVIAALEIINYKVTFE